MPKLTYGLIGHPVGHSLSPAMQNAAFKSLDIDAEYKLFDVEPAGLTDFLQSASGKLSGFNVTIPHKIKTKEFLEKNGSLDSNASRLGAVNTVKVVPSGKLCGYNTDGPGFYRSLVEDLRFEPEGKNIVVLGAGGAASAITIYLGGGPNRIYVYDVDEEKVHDLESNYTKFYGQKKFAAVKSDGLKKAIADSQLLVNATPVGMKEDDPSPVDKELLHAGMYVYDLVYNRSETSMVRAARLAKCHAAAGIGMLLYQGVIAFEIWTDRPAPVAVMKDALCKAMRCRV